MELKVKTDKIYSIIFIILCSLGCLLSYYEYSGPTDLYMILGYLLSLIFITIFSNKIYNKTKIYSNKKALMIFFIEFFVSVFIISYKEQLLNYKSLITIMLLASLFICYFFGIKFSDFNWNFNFKSAMFILGIFVLNTTLPVIMFNTYNPHNARIFNITPLTFLTEFLKLSLYPGLLEEVIFRGFLISGLKAYGMEEYKINIIQSVLFGILHYSLYLQWGIIGVISTCYQTLSGYILGKVYFKTKSLTPCILLHGLIDINLW